jgi:uncharacterized protein
VNLGGRAALVTGASGGLGQAIARALARRGARLVVTARQTDVIEALAAETGGRAIACDLADRGSLERLVEEAGPVDVLVASAGNPGSGRLESFALEEIDRAIDVNLRAPMILARLLCEGMAERRSGHIVFISSLTGKAATPRISVYAATKFGLRGFAQGLRQDLQSRGVGVSTVLPGFIRDAGMFHEAGATLPGYVGTRTPADVADAVISAIERNRAEVEVAPLSVRLGALFASLAPDTAAALQRRLDGDKLAAEMELGQRDKR